MNNAILEGYKGVYKYGANEVYRKRRASINFTPSSSPTSPNSIT